MIIGITGLARSGKDTVADYLVNKHNFKKLNMSDLLKEELIKRREEPTKMNLSKLGDEWRTRFGRGVMMLKILQKARNYKDVVITGIRSPEEIIHLKEKERISIIISVEAPTDTRFKRRHELDPKTKEEFQERDTRDINNKGTEDAIKLSDHNINNNSTIYNLFTKIDIIIKSLKHQ